MKAERVSDSSIDMHGGESTVVTRWTILISLSTSPLLDIQFDLANRSPGVGFYGFSSPPLWAALFARKRPVTFEQYISFYIS
jgi:hypothetical protein